MGTINGHARPIVGGAGVFADHTNVSCTGVPGKLWVCCGVPPAGPIICSGKGSTKSADCFSKPALAFGLNDTTGILYGITGVCHQAANRILFAAGQAINNKCRGIRASMALYGQFGIQTQMLKVRWALKGKFGAIIILNRLIKKGLVIDWLTKLNTCVNIQGDLPPCLPPAGVVPPPITLLSPEESAFIASIINLSQENQHWPEDDLYIEIILMMLTQGMSSNEKEEFRVPVMKFINEYLTEHANITGDFITNEINTIQFVEKSNGNVLGAQEALSGFLGPDQFKIGMSAEIGEFFQLIEPEIAMEFYGQQFSL